MSATDAPLNGDALLDAVTDAMVALHARYHHREPLSAKSMLMSGELLACVMGGVYTDVEKTMIELERKALVHETRSAFQQAMEQRFIVAVQGITGRRVAKFISTHHVGPDLELEIFVMETPIRV